MSHGNSNGILNSLVDFSFTSFVTTKLIKILYALGLILGGLSSIGAILRAFALSFGMGFASLIIVPLLFLLFAMYLRVVLEVLAVVFRIAEDVRVLANNRMSESSVDA